MKKQTDLGMNRTGIASSPVDSKDVIETAAKANVGAPDGMALMKMRVELTADAGIVGTVPVPTTLKGAASTAKEMLKGEKASVLIDKLGERIAFERNGVRLYDGLLVKFDAYGTWDGGPTRETLMQFRDEELEHFQLAKTALLSLGGDPTAMTPSADVAAVASLGVVKVITDPRTDLQAAIEAILIAELTDNACWETLTDLARGMNQTKIAESFESARAQEARHLLSVRQWVRRAIGEDAGAELPDEIGIAVPPPDAP